MLKSLDDIQIEYGPVAIWDSVNQIEQLIRAHLADDIRLYRGIRKIISEIVDGFSFTVFNMPDTGIDTDAADPSFEGALLPVLRQVLENPDKTVLHDIFRMLLPGIPSADGQ